jgi:hypothetical protein
MNKANDIVYWIDDLRTQIIAEQRKAKQLVGRLPPHDPMEVYMHVLGQIERRVDFLKGRAEIANTPDA